MVKEPKESGLMVGLEVHQQLQTSTKLFCSCPPLKSEELPYSFERRLRPAQSETGRVDPAAVFEFAKGKSNLYLWSPESSCLVEADEEPPHPASEEAIDITIQVSRLLSSSLVDEVHVMRKIVIDGSNTPGFQRTAVVGLGGFLRIDGSKVGVQSVTIEEDAARILGEDAKARRFALDRLGVPLVEVALDPVAGTPEFIGKVALHLGRTLRSTGRVARGLGTIRQDLNVSFNGGAVVEVKGVQKLNLVAKVVAYEMERHRAMLEVAKRIRRGRRKVKCSVVDVTEAMRETGSRVVSKALGEGGMVTCVVASGLEGLLGWEPIPGFRLGKEVAEVARANSLGGVIHSDEFREQGISEEEDSKLRTRCGAPKGSALVLVAGPAAKVNKVSSVVADRLEAAPGGVPAETRAATDAGETVYMRPRPGAQRMYPETDIPEISLGPSRVSRVAKTLPEAWEKTVRRYEREHGLSHDLALRVFDSDHGGAFERLSGELRLDASVIASVLVELPVRLSREGVPEESLSEANLTEALVAIDRGKVAKEAAPDIFRAIGRGEAKGVTEAISSLKLETMDEAELSALIDGLLTRRNAVVREKGEGAFSPLMGEVMAVARGRADGKVVSRVLREKLSRALRKRT